MEHHLEFEAGKLLHEQGMHLVTAESCTGGLISHWMTNIPGSSEYFLGGVVAYDYRAKERALGVQRFTLEKYGAVSRETALEMAAGARTLLEGEYPLDSMIGLSATGIAGPGGATPDKPVGLVWIGLATPHGSQAWRFIWDGSRTENKKHTACQALQLLIEYLKTHELAEN